LDDARAAREGAVRSGREARDVDDGADAVVAFFGSKSFGRG